MKEDDSEHVEDYVVEQPKMEYKDEEKVVTKKKTMRPRRPLSSIPKKEGGGSILDLPAKLLEIQKRLQYVAQEVKRLFTSS